MKFPTIQTQGSASTGDATEEGAGRETGRPMEKEGQLSKRRDGEEGPNLVLLVHQEEKSSYTHETDG